MTLKNAALEIYRDALQAVSPENLLRACLGVDAYRFMVRGTAYPLRQDQKIHVFGSGKAAIESAKAVERILGDRVSGGLVVSSYEGNGLETIEAFRGSHPVPTKKSVLAADLLIRRLSALSEDDFFIYLLSGGSSSLVEKPVRPVTLNALQKTIQLLLKNGVPIEEMNVVRKHLSLVKGGRLGDLPRAKGIVLVVSDVIGDGLDTIGSGPFFPDPSSYGDARDILMRHGLWERLPASVKFLITQGIAGVVPETPKEPNANIAHRIVGNNLLLLKQARQKAETLGWTAHIITSRLRGEAREVAKAIVCVGEEILETRQPFAPPVCLLFGGETTVTVKGAGKGGRNQEMCLAALREIRDRKNILFLSAGSDGIDGNSDAAGAVIDCESHEKARILGLNTDDYLNRNDSYGFFRQTGDLIITGPTGTNVMDVSMLLIGKEKS
jgi:hydroxypyruvate reductase/glycerate 2-kinase